LGLPRLLRPLPPEREAALCSGKSKAEWALVSLDIARKQGNVCFDLFAKLARQVLEACPSVCAITQSCFPLIIVDEFQDTDDDQWAVLDVISRGQRLIALADPHQRIYDFRSGVRPERIDEFLRARRATVINFGSNNHRSPSSDVLRFADHILTPGAPRFCSNNVTVRSYRYPNQIGVTTKHEIANAKRAVEKARGPGPVSIAVLAATNHMVRSISASLRRPTPAANWNVQHDVFVDSNEMTNAWHVVLAIMGGRAETFESHATEVLRRIGDFYLSQDTQDGRQKAERIKKWISHLSNSEWPKRAPLAEALRSILASTRTFNWSGAPDTDIARLLDVLERRPNSYLEVIVEWCRTKPPVCSDDSAYKALAALFRSTGDYRNAGLVFERALIQERLAERFRPSYGCSVMTMHRCKGREYDAVVIVDGQSPRTRLVLHDDKSPFEKSRRLLRVAITRARHCVRIITPQNDRCPLIP